MSDDCANFFGNARLRLFGLDVHVHRKRGGLVAKFSTPRSGVTALAVPEDLNTWTQVQVWLGTEALNLAAQRIDMAI